MEPVGRRLRLTRSPSSGYTLVEVVVAALLASIIATAVMSVSLTSKMNGGQSGKSDRRLLAGHAMKDVSSALRNFVTACCDINRDCILWTPGVPAPAYSCYPLTGPNRGGADGGWTFNGYQLPSGTVSDPAFAGKYALLSGTHRLAHVLPAWFEAAPYNGYVQYTVTPGPSYPSGAPYPTTNQVPQVVVTANWTEPVSP